MLTRIFAVSALSTTSYASKLIPSVTRLIFIASLGIYDEVPGKFGVKKIALRNPVPPAESFCRLQPQKHARQCIQGSTFSAHENGGGGANPVSALGRLKLDAWRNAKAIPDQGSFTMYSGSAGFLSNFLRKEQT